MTEPIVEPVDLRYYRFSDGERVLVALLSPFGDGVDIGVKGRGVAAFITLPPTSVRALRDALTAILGDHPGEDEP